MNLVPKIAPSFWVDTGCRFIEQKQSRLVKQARGEREPLLPSAGELARELASALGEAKVIEALPHCLSSSLHVVHTCDEIEIFLDAQILPETESLRHVTNFTLDRFTLVDDVVAKTRAAAFVRSKQSAEHP